MQIGRCYLLWVLSISSLPINNNKRTQATRTRRDPPPPPPPPPLPPQQPQRRRQPATATTEQRQQHNLHRTPGSCAPPVDDNHPRMDEHTFCPDGWLDRSQMEYDPTAIVSTSSRTPPSAHHPSIHPSIHPPTHPQYTSTFGLLGTQGNVPLGTTIDLSFTEGGHVANFFTNSVPLVTRPFFLPFEWPGLVLCQLAAS
ncbi:hypothetical protein BDL97_02G021800 [Sphagnum fallax]|nr:hypothetical protein BDL97_02G021800 [Sphagnum fallax]